MQIPHIRRSRSAALVNLDADLHAPILASLLDLNINTAVQWTEQAGRDWSRYLDARIDTTASKMAGNSAATAGDGLEEI